MYARVITCTRRRGERLYMNWLRTECQSVTRPQALDMTV